MNGQELIQAALNLVFNMLMAAKNDENTSELQRYKESPGLDTAISMVAELKKKLKP